MKSDQPFDEPDNIAPEKKAIPGSCNRTDGSCLFLFSDVACLFFLLSVHVLQKFHEFRMADFFILVVKECIGVGACITRFTHGIEIRDFFEQTVIDLV